MNDMSFPTIDPQNPYAFTEEEEEVMAKIKSSFVNSEKLQAHTRMLFAKGSMYKIFNSNLLFHGCIPMNEDGSLTEKFKSLGENEFMNESGSIRKDVYVSISEFNFYFKREWYFINLLITGFFIFISSTFNFYIPDFSFFISLTFHFYFPRFSFFNPPVFMSISPNFLF